MRSAILILSTLTVALPLALVACQGEFRETYGPTSPTSEAAPATAAAQPPSAPAALAPTAAPPAPSASVATAAAPSAAPPAPTGGESAPVATAAPATGSISGTITVRPQVLAYAGKNVVVWLDNPPAQPPATDNGATADLDQRGMNFIPILTVVRVGGKVRFLNADPFPHNIFTPDFEKFNLGTMPHGASLVRQFDHPGRYSLLCNLHPNMLAYVIVTPSSWFTQPDKDGKFTMPAVPNGTYTVKAWGGRLGEQTQTVTVNGGDAAVEFHLQQAD